VPVLAVACAAVLLAQALAAPVLAGLCLVLALGLGLGLRLGLRLRKPIYEKLLVCERQHACPWSEVSRLLSNALFSSFASSFAPHPTPSPPHPTPLPPSS
jgi:Na+/H+ antiporter NhaA